MISPAPLEQDAVLDVSWINQFVGAQYPGAKALDITIEESITTLATKTRFRVKWDTSSAREAPPENFCVKGFFDPKNKARAFAGICEARFYAEIAPHLDITIPHCIYSGIDDSLQHGIILMEDLISQGAQFLLALNPYTADQTAATLTQLANLHAAGWHNPPFARGDWLNSRIGGYTDYASPERVSELMADGRGELLSAEIKDGRRIHRAFEALLQHVAISNSTLIHGDAHAGNLYISANGTPGIIDWQVFQKGPWWLDVAYHIASVLDVDERERNETALLKHYLESLARLGVEAPAFDEAWQNYQKGLVYGLFLWAITQQVEASIVTTLISRLGIAVEQHGSFALLEG